MYNIWISSPVTCQIILHEIESPKPVGKIGIQSNEKKRKRKWRQQQFQQQQKQKKRVSQHIRNIENKLAAVHTLYTRTGKMSRRYRKMQKKSVSHARYWNSKEEKLEVEFDIQSVKKKRGRDKESDEAKEDQKKKHNICMMIPYR